jgi:hypothetical protein
MHANDSAVPPRDTSVEEDPHPGAPSSYAATAFARRADFASSRTATACFRETLGKSPRKASSESPASR